MDRREFLRGAAGVAAGAAVSQCRSKGSRRRPARAIAKPVEGGEFLQGVASGQPTHRAMTLWSKLSEVEKAGTVVLEVAKDPGFGNVVERRKVRTQRRSDHSIKARVRGLDPHERYFYRFETPGEESPVGEFRTLPPPGSKAPVKIGVFSCQDYVAGFYTAHAGLLAEDDLDLVVCLGDYIYERQYYDPQREDTTGQNGDGEVQTLPEYRDKYALYHSDPNLQALRARYPSPRSGTTTRSRTTTRPTRPGEATLDPRVPFPKRKRNGYRAYFEHMPFAPAGSRGKKDRFRIYRSIKLGHTAEILLLDQRQYRDEQPCGGSIPPTPPCTDAERDDPERTYLGDEQMAWLKRRLEASKATWKLIGNQAMIMAFDVPATQPINVDQWDGYGADRAELMAHIAEKEISDVSFLTGDIHTFFAGQVSETGRQTRRRHPGLPRHRVRPRIGDLARHPRDDQRDDRRSAAAGAPGADRGQRPPPGQQPALRLLRDRAPRLRRRHRLEGQARGRVPLAADDARARVGGRDAPGLQVASGTPEVQVI